MKNKFKINKILKIITILLIAFLIINAFIPRSLCNELKNARIENCYFIYGSEDGEFSAQKNLRPSEEEQFLEELRPILLKIKGVPRLFESLIFFEENKGFFMKTQNQAETQGYDKEIMITSKKGSVCYDDYPKLMHYKITNVDEIYPELFDLFNRYGFFAS